MNLCPELPDINICKIKQISNDYECIVHKTIYYFNCEYAVGNDSAMLCTYPNKYEFMQSCNETNT
jgi:hypothetical protein